MWGCFGEAQETTGISPCLLSMVQAFWLGVFGKFELEQGTAKTICHELLKFWRLDLIVSSISYFSPKLFGFLTLYALEAQVTQ